MYKRTSTNIPSFVPTPERPLPTILLRRREASLYLKNVRGVDCASSTLAKLFCVGGGPCVHKVGRFPCYDPADLDEWAQSRIGPKLRSSSDRAGAK